MYPAFPVIPVPLTLAWAVTEFAEKSDYSGNSHCGQGYSLLNNYWILEGPRVFFIVVRNSVFFFVKDDRRRWNKTCQICSEPRWELGTCHIFCILISHFLFFSSSAQYFHPSERLARSLHASPGKRGFDGHQPNQVRKMRCIEMLEKMGKITKEGFICIDEQ